MKKKSYKQIGSKDIFARFPSETNSWLLSYSDIITMLLCFFMLFYAAEKQDSSESFNEILAFVKDELGLKDFKKEDVGNVKKIISQRFGQSGEGFIQEMEKLVVKGEREVLNFSNYVSVEFPQGNLFNSGEVELNAEALSKIRPIMEKLLPFQDQLMINVVAYTDATKVRQLKNRWWKNNEELSALRALTVQKKFLDFGFQKKNVYISGRGIKSQDDVSEATDLEGKLIDTKSFSEARTISIRLEARNK